MEYFVSVILPILLLILGFWFIKINYRSYFLNWKKELTLSKILRYGSLAVSKSIIILILIIIIHNNFHNDHRLELFLFILLYLLFATFQSAYSIGGFISRMKYVGLYALSMFRKKSKEADDYIDKVFDSSFLRFSFLIKILIVIVFIIIFTPSITIFVVSNIFYFLIILSMLLLSLILNNIIYFGLISLIIYQFDPIGISISEVNYIVLTSSYLVILVGIVIETRMDNRMFRIVASRMVKSLNFKKGYTMIYYKKNKIVYQNKINNYYYVYFRLNGIVTVFESMYDAKLTNFLVRKMIFKGTQYLREFDE